MEYPASLNYAQLSRVACELHVLLICIDVLCNDLHSNFAAIPTPLLSKADISSVLLGSFATPATPSDLLGVLIRDSLSGQEVTEVLVNEA